MITVSSFTVSSESFAPDSYACKHSSNLHKRYAELAETLGLHDNLETPYFVCLNIHICQQSHCKKSLAVTDIVSKKGCKTLHVNGIFEYKSLTTFLESNSTLNSAYLNLVVINEGSKYLEEITALKDQYCHMLLIIIAAENSEELAEPKYQAVKSTSDNIIVTSRKKVNDAIGDELERIVLKTINPKCENVDKWLNEKKCSAVNNGAPGGSRKRKSFFEACSKIKDIYRPGLPIKDKESDKPFHVPHASRCINGHVSTNKKNMTLQMNNKRNDRLQGVDRDTLDSLLAEMIALYNNSRVPDYEQPQVSQYVEKEISEKLRRKLLAISSVIGVGYRFTCFVVYVERSEENECQQQKIRSVLEDYDINDYEIQSVSELRNLCRVGNKIRTTRRCRGRDKPVEGTFGCFANIKDGNDTNIYALISKHVAKFCDSFYISTTSEIVGNVIAKSVTETGLDIAALRLVFKDKNNKICAKFKTETLEDESLSESEVGDDGYDLLPGKLYPYCDHLENSLGEKICNGQKVYIWGGVSKPGKGVITMRAYQYDNMKTLIQIQDRMPSKEGEIPERFCYPGDSGAIVCAEDSRGKFVHVLAMIMGIINEDAVKNNPKIRGKYLTVPLSSGLEELKERTGFSFQICESIDS